MKNSRKRCIPSEQHTREKEIGQILKYSDSIIFNSFYQLDNMEKQHRKAALRSA